MKKITNTNNSLSDFMIAIHGLTLIAHKKKFLNSSELALNLCVNPVRVRKVMSLLLKKKILVSIKGKMGGYNLALNPSNITLAEILEALNFNLLETNWEIGDLNQTCVISSGMMSFFSLLFSKLNNKLKEELATINLSEIEQFLIINKNKGV
ncbi:RrF2 family transcriptional regulator [Mycoplasmopsis gallopavonis]|uniref:HTH-type transcriptional regulator ywnA n=1 Tax=Mycoplasmopsis gallopavonis TaxID=76629 RepID=A0A449B003_9BACT|nr:Rrf2 family transcriptional regulator [Mycoplasmopsis gallopavonis]RIV16434.1 transcriptional regulator [Mycoplasmopsis gallopavonis]VEU73046.1 Putative HTH-type transcriptional regulator ywnA [Mycoplasmopsis gallopavonis]